MSMASERGARVAHFPERALSGYAGTDFETFEGFDWTGLSEAAAEIAGHARRLGMCPQAAQQLVCDQRRRPGRRALRQALLLRCSRRAFGRPGACGPGGHFSVWTIDGVRCGALICHDYRCPSSTASTPGVASMSSSIPFTRRGYRPSGSPRSARRSGPSSPDSALPRRTRTRDRDACRHDDGRALQPHLDQLPELLGPAELLTGLLRACRRHHDRQAPPEQGRSTGVGRRHRPGTLQFDSGVAEPGHGRRLP